MSDILREENMTDAVKKSEIYVPRVTQLDSNEFDKEIHNLLINNLLEIGRFLTPGFLNNVRHEIELIVKLLAFKYSLLRGNSTFGQKLLNVQYHETLTRKKAIWFVVLKFLMPYLKDKHDDDLLNWSNRDVKKLLDRIELGVKICQILNLVTFLKQGIYPNLVDRILGLKIVPRATLSRNLDYTFMMRELMWHGFMELLMYIYPLINYQQIRKKAFSLFSSKQIKPMKDVVFNLNTICSICHEVPIYPCRISFHCSHVACYYCLQGNVMADREYICPSCGVKNTASISFQYLNDELWYC